MNKKTISIAIALALAVGINGNVFAVPSSTPTTVKQAQDQRREIETKVEKLDSQITEAMIKVADNKKKMDKLAQDIKSAQVELESSEKNIKGQQDLFNKRVRAMYINGVDSYLGVVLQSDNLGDFMSRVDTVKKIVGFDQKVMNDLKEKRDTLTNKKQSLCDETNKLSALKTDNENKLSKLKTDKEDAVKLATTLSNQEKALASAEQAKVQQSTTTAASTPASTPSRGGSTSISSSSDVVAYASNFLGLPYQWGGNGPNSFDCSGFTCYVYAHFGVSIPRIASDQQGAGRSVSRDQLQPGDLVFFGSAGAAHHVGIYVGNGSYIHAPKTGDVIKISSLGSRSDFCGGARVR